MNGATICTLAAEAHAAGDALLAVAEGDAEKQPSETMLAHIFSCAKCTENLRDIRRGLLGLAGGAGANAPVDLLGLVTSADVAPTPEDADVARSRKLIVKVAIVGGLLAIGLVFLRSFAANLG